MEEESERTNLKIEFRWGTFFEQENSQDRKLRPAWKIKFPPSPSSISSVVEAPGRRAGCKGGQTCRIELEKDLGIPFRSFDGDEELGGINLNKEKSAEPLDSLV